MLVFHGLTYEAGGRVSERDRSRGQPPHLLEFLEHIKQGMASATSLKALQAVAQLKNPKE